MMPRVLLVNPPAKRIVEKRYDLPQYGRVGLACLAAYLRHVGIECQIIDAKFARLGANDVLDCVRRFQPTVVGITAFTNEINQAAALAGAIKSSDARITTVVGGVHVTALPERTLDEFPAFDIGCLGEGELTFADLCRALGEGAAPTSLASIDGIVYRTPTGQPRRTAPRPLIASLDDVPSPAWDLLPAARTYLVTSSRGCPFTCMFCMNPNGRKVRMRSPAHIMAEIDFLMQRFSPRELVFCDEVLTLDGARLHALLDLMIAAGYPKRLSWCCQTHVNFLDEDLLGKMKRAGCSFVGIGIETGNDEKLRAMKKGLTKEKVLTGAHMLKKAGMPFEGYFILGHPNETWQTATDTVDFAVRVNPTYPVFGIMVPYPGTLIAEKAQRGEWGYRLTSENWDDYNKQLGDAVEFEHLSRSQLERLQLLGYLKVFLRNYRFLDLVRFVWKYRLEGWEFGKKFLKSLRRSPASVRA